MKGLKYILFIFLTFLLFPNTVTAYKIDNHLYQDNDKTILLANGFGDSTDRGGGFSNSDETTDSTTETEGFDTKTFCNRAEVSRIFRAMGWILFILKVVIPIVIVVFGCIDFGKAMIASKDDEIKKAAKSLAIRSIAGIAIFFVPAIVDFIVNVIDYNDTYKGSQFKVCTDCILHPNECVVKKFEYKKPAQTQKPTESSNSQPNTDSNTSESQNPSTNLNVSSGTNTKTLGGISYIETVPENASSNLPLIIFLHGTSEKGKLAQVMNLKPVTFVTSNQAFKNGKFIFIAPVLPSNYTYWKDIQSKIMNIINTTVSTYKINKNKIIIMGFSLGGVDVWNYVYQNPNFFSAAVPVSGCPIYSDISKYTNTPIWAMSGNQESTYISCMSNFVNSINQSGGNAKYSYAGTNHAGAQSSFPNDNVFTWALGQTKK